MTTTPENFCGGVTWDIDKKSKNLLYKARLNWLKKYLSICYYPSNVLTLAGVLRAVGKSYIGFNEIAKELVNLWDLAHDSLEDQSDETIEYSYNIFKNEL